MRETYNRNGKHRTHKSNSNVRWLTDEELYWGEKEFFVSILDRVDTRQLLLLHRLAVLRVGYASFPVWDQEWADYLKAVLDKRPHVKQKVKLKLEKM
ncbi:MAG: hypothetical protein GY861_21810 [bacterium]|nr:hypothetical protein [bacterium]